MADTIASRKIDSLTSLNVTVVSSSVHQYLNYSKKMQVRLAEINNNVSSVIKESCSGIDNICNRVRQCLNEMDQRHKTYLTDEVTEYDIEEEKSKSCDEISQEIEETADYTSAIDIIEEEKLDKGQDSKTVTSLTPFFTEINYNQDPDNRESCHKKVLNKTIYSLLNTDSMEIRENDSRISLENFKEAMTTLCDNFEMMNKLVENINKEIREFSETAIPRSLEKNNSKEINKITSGLKPIKRLSKSNSRQKSVQVGDHLSETEIDFIELNNRSSSSFIIPDVYRKRAFTDLYQKLVAQVEANDSLIFFQTLMNRQKKLQKNENTVSQYKLNIPIMSYSIPKKSVSNSSNQIQPPKKTDMNKKYADSLWFSQKNMIRDSSRSKSRTVSKKNVRSKKVNNKTVESRSFKSEQGERTGSLKRKSAISESNKSLVQGKGWPKTGSTGDVTKKVCSLECTCRMVVQNDMPPSASTKCHLQWLKAKPPHTLQRKLKFLDILDDLTHRDLLPLQSEYPRKDNQQARELDYKDIQDTYLYKLMYGKQSTKNVWKQLLMPTIHQSPKTYTFSKSPRCASAKKVKEEKVSESFMEKFCSQNYSKSDILKKLSPYIYDPGKTHENYSHSIIVMPVRVYYDNFKRNEPPTKLSNPNKPFKAPRKPSDSPVRDNKSSKSPELSPPRISKPIRVVYDTLPKKQEIRSITTSIKPSVMPSKSIISSARLNLEKNAMKKVTSRSFPPKSFAPYCQNVKNGRKDPLDTDHEENIALYTKIQADIERIKREIYGKKGCPSERKLWANKYGKSVGQKLISFVDHQKPEMERPVPLYAMPKLDIVSTPPSKRKAVSFTEKTSPQKQVMRHVKKLKTKNEAIQNNLKKAINVIETRMMDILTDDNKSVQAFDIMEKEITNVLSLMKCKGNMDLKAISSKSSVSKDEVGVNTSLEENYDIISEHLFERLERILDTGGSSMSNTSIHQIHELIPQKVKEEQRKKQKNSSSRRAKISIISPSSSTSLDGNKANRRSLKTHSKKTEKSEVNSNLSATTTALITEPISTEHWESICGDQNSVKNISIENEPESQSEKGMEEDKSQICEDQIWRNSSGDFVKQEEVTHKSDISLDNVEKHDITIENIIIDVKVEKLITEKKSELLPEILSPKQNIDVSNTTINSDMEDFITEELNKVIESIVSLAEEASTKQPQEEPVAVPPVEKETIEFSDYKAPQLEPSDDVENKMQVAIRDVTDNYSEEVHKILKRVEHIYYQLDDIQESESIDRIPIFKEAEVPDIRSEIFLTPFMHAVKENRTVKQASKMALVERSPSYYNVITFLDALTNIQKETPYEVHFAQLHNYVHVYHQATVYYQAELWHEARYSSSTSTSLRASCLRKSSDETKQIKNKKVSFRQLGKEDKSNQVTLCPFHKVKVLRISSQQFPPLESSSEDIYRTICDSNTEAQITEIKTETEIDGTEDIVWQKHCPIHYSDWKKHCPHTHNKLKQLLCASHAQIEKIKNEGCCEKTKQCKMSVIDDKSTQVFCQMQTEKKQEENSITNNTAEENAANLTSNDEQSADCPEYLEANPDDSKSTDKDFLEDSLLDPFYDYTNECITPKGVMQKIEGIYEEGNANAVQPQPKVVVFREVLDSSLQPMKTVENANDVELYKKRLEKRKEMRLSRKSSAETVRTVSESHSDNENVVLLKSFYAIVYILMFTALSLDYTCI